jgi:hypothetical protein
MRANGSSVVFELPCRSLRAVSGVECRLLEIGVYEMIHGSARNYTFRCLD